MNLNGNQASIREVCDAGLLAGAVTVVWQRGEVLQVNEIGYRDVDAGLPMGRDTLFRIASMTKPVTVAAAMSLVDEGKLALRDPIVHWAPEMADVQVLDDPHGPLDRTQPGRRAILVEDLLTHTSGLAYGFSVSGPISHAYVRLPFGRGPDAWLSELAALPLVHQPGEESPTATRQICWASSFPASRTNRFTRSSTNESWVRRACPTPGSSSPPKRGDAPRRCTGLTMRAGCGTT